MADFVAVIRRAVDGLSDKSPAMRERVYDKARTAVRRQLENMSPRPSDAAIESQLGKLETAIGSVEAEFAEPFLSVEDLAPETAPADPPAPEPAAPQAVPTEPEEERQAQLVDAEPAPREEPAADPQDDGGAAEEPADPPAAGREAERKPAAVAPVPFGSYAMGRAPSFPVRPQTPPAEASRDGFQPSRYQTNFGAPRQEPAPEPEPEVAEAPPAEEPQAEPVAATPLQTAEPAAEPSVVAEDVPPAEPVESTVLEAEPAAEPPEEAAAEPAEVPPTPVGAWPAPAEEAPVAAAEPPAEPAPEPTSEPTAARPQSPAPAPAEPEPIIFEDEPAETRSPEAIFEDELRQYEAAPRQPAAPAANPAAGAGGAFSHDDAFGFGGPDERLTEKPAARPASRRSKAKLVGAATPKKRGSGKRIAILLAALLLVAGAGFAAWSNQETIVAMFSGGQTAPVEEPAETAGAPEAPAEDGSEEVAALPGEDAPADDAPVAKFTQRLQSDGTEIDAGPAPVSEQPVPGEEGRSLSVQSEPSADPAPGEDAAISESEIAESDAAEPQAVAEAEQESAEAASGDALEVGQTMFLYEERLGSLPPTAIEGSVVWSIVNESPGGDAQPEAAIRAEIDVPEKDLSALMTIKRNADASLPASHLIEIVFSLPATFEGGGIESVQRVAFKESEQDRGNELIAVPAKITDDFFMVALNDYAEAVSTNTTLMRERNWIDIPVVYGNGRRALITLEKGSSGIDVFNEALGVWQRRMGGSAGQ